MVFGINIFFNSNKKSVTVTGPEDYKTRQVKEMSHSELEQLAGLLHERNAIARRITEVIGRPAQIGHVGEFIASRIFDIQLEYSAVAMGIDGRFKTGPLKDQTVNIKFYGKKEGLLDIRLDALPDYFLVMTGPKSRFMHSRGQVRPWYIDYVFLFNADRLVEQLTLRRVKIGVATSVVTAAWDAAEIYPLAQCGEYSLAEHQINMLQLFGSGGNSQSISA